MNNYAFIDGQNLHAGVKQLGWRIDHKRLVSYLQRKYGVKKAYYFIGYVPQNAPLYGYLRRCNYDLRFKPAIPGTSGSLKGNVDADLVLQAMIDFPHFDRAVLVSGDGDYYSLVRHLRLHDKLQAVLSPNRQFCSALIKKEARGRLWFMEDIKHLVETQVCEAQKIGGRLPRYRVHPPPIDGVIVIDWSTIVQDGSLAAP